MDWNDLPDSLITSAEMSDDFVSNNNEKFRSVKSKENIHKKEVGPYRSFA